ncbi:6-phosphogluconolactonase [Polynucleobacter sp. MWH-UH2A]|uniref:6-phosphogluconolactonase n=1 Tax=Polynucleobacter sp. MWH-UH2A TaxID=1855617 RepID=UPI001BFD5A2D|nr:6-phosphogluconolactonase [Polynucleobacter sp. MWH-UH2A]QWD64364.1 6-phosphogluconolactonase [Polynucleobacter sp. MWH-UH2A]
MLYSNLYVQMISGMNIFCLDDWVIEAASILHSKVEEVLLEKGKCSILLTGGRSGASLYEAWSSKSSFQDLKNIDFYFGDERCVPFKEPDSNYALVNRTLFSRGIPPGCNLHRIKADSSDLEGVAMHYAALLPQQIDVALFGIGDDGHIASLFPGSLAIREKRRRVLPVVTPYKPSIRITISPLVIKDSDSIFALAPGPKKAAIFKSLHFDCSATGSEAIPARLLTRAIWLIEKRYL